MQMITHVNAQTLVTGHALICAIHPQLAKAAEYFDHSVLESAHAPFILELVERDQVCAESGSFHPELLGQNQGEGVIYPSPF